MPPSAAPAMSPSAMSRAWRSSHAATEASKSPSAVGRLCSQFETLGVSHLRSGGSQRIERIERLSPFPPLGGLVYR